MTVAALFALGGLGLAACGGSSPSSTSTTASATRATCQAVAAVLSDGPTPAADPAGYAEAQVLPLRQVRTTDAALHSAIDELAAAYAQVSSTDAGPAATMQLRTAAKRIDALCPGTTVAT